MASHQAKALYMPAGLLIAANAGLLMMAGALPSLHLASTYVASVNKLVSAARTASHQKFAFEAPCFSLTRLSALVRLCPVQCHIQDIAKAQCPRMQVPTKELHCKGTITRMLMSRCHGLRAHGHHRQLPCRARPLLAHQRRCWVAAAAGG